MEGWVVLSDIFKADNRPRMLRRYFVLSKGRLSSMPGGKMPGYVASMCKDNRHDSAFMLYGDIDEMAEEEVNCRPDWAYCRSKDSISLSGCINALDLRLRILRFVLSYTEG